MKGFYSLFILLMAGISIHAQNYAPVYANRTIHYFGDTSRAFQTYFSPYIIGLQTNSFTVQAQDTIIDGYDTKPESFTPYGCDSAGISLQGPKIIKGSQFTYFFNRNMDTIRFKHSGLIGDGWKFFDLENDSTINAYIYSKDTMSINGIIDSVTYVSLLMTDSVGSNLIPVNVASNDTLVVSKHFGLLSFKNWLNYPDTNQRTKAFRTNITIPTREDIYDFDIGDEFHYRYTYSPPSGPPTYFNLTYLNKWYSNQQDTLYYERLVKSESSSIDFSTNPPTATIHSTQFIDTSYYTGLDSQIFNGVAKQMILSPNSFTLFNFLTNMNVKSGYISNITPKRKQGTRVMIEGHFQYTYDSQNDCYFSSYPIQYYTFGEGIGLVWDYSLGGIGAPNEEISLIYYQKGNETWGTPYNIMVGQDEIKNTINQISILPNPSENKIQISGLETTSEIRIYNLGGQMILNERISPDQLIDISSLKDGLHIIEISNNKGLFRKKFVKN